MAEFIEIIRKDSTVQKEITQTMEKYNKESFSTIEVGQKAFIQSKVKQ